MSDVQINVTGSGFVPGIPGSYGSVELDVFPGTTLDVYNQNTLLRETALADFYYPYIALEGFGIVPASLVINVKDSPYGAVGNGVTDDTTAISVAISTANSAGGGIVYFPPGTYITATQTLYSKVHLCGAGIETSILKLKNGANADLLQGSVAGYGGGVIANIAAANATGSTGGIYNWSISNLTLDGNKSNQSGTSYGIRVYGYGFLLQNLRVRQCLTDGIYADWNGGGTASPAVDQMEAQIINVKIHDCGGVGIKWAGPHDSQFVNVLSFLNGLHCFHAGPNATALLWTNSHGWGPASGSLAWLIEAGYGQYTGCVGEGSDTVNVALLAGECSLVGCHIFGAGTFTTTGLQIGQNAGGTPYSGSTFQSGGVTTAVTVGGYYVSSFFSRNEGTHGAIWFVNDGGGVISAQSYQTAGNVYTGSPAPKTLLQIHATGLTADGTQGKGGTFILPINAFSAFVARDDNSNDIFNLNTNSKRFETPNNVEFKAYTDAYSTIAYRLNYDGVGSILTNGSLSVGQSSSAAAVANSGTITTSGVSVARVNPGGAVTGVILQAGTQAGQLVTVVNESANSITFAASGSSHVADGASDVIAATSARSFVWDSGNSLWYKCV